MDLFELAKPSLYDTLLHARVFFNTMVASVHRIVETGEIWDHGVIPSNKGLGNHGWPIGMFLWLMLFQFVFNWAMRLLIVQPLARVFLQRYSKRRRPIKQGVVDKFGQSALEFFFYSVNTVFGVLIASSQPWIWPSVYWWKDQPNNHLDPAVLFFYLLTGSRYAQGVVSVFCEHKRKDFTEMLVHHTVTVALVYLSYTFGMVRVGTVIMCLFDCADPSLHMAKMIKYFADLRPVHRGCCNLAFVADLCFASFILSFLCTRLIAYPYVVWSAVVEMYNLYSGENNYDTVMEHINHIGTPVLVCIILLFILLSLQVFWFGLILKVLYKLVMEGDLKDNRSDSEMSESEDDPLAKKKQ